jgi:two-component system cell cycle sensor histidine kinase/response regulator CckA
MMNPNQRQSVLIVEDERIVAKDLQLTLGELGYDAFAIASSAEEAIARASERCPDLVLMDVRIKGRRDGIETAEILRNRFDVPVVYITAHADSATLDRAKKTEPYGYLLKPINSAELRSVVEVSLYKHAMEKRLRERERWFSGTLRSIADAVIAVDIAGNVKFMNPAAEHLTGVTATVAAGKPVREVLCVVGSQSGGDDMPILTALHEGRSVELLEGLVLNLSNGVSRVINDSAAPVVDEAAHQTLGAVMVFRDVTEQKKLQQQAELAGRLATLGTLAAGVGHEVRNPLAVVVANAEFLSEELTQLREGGLTTVEANQLFANMTEALTDLQSAASRMGRIVSDLSAFTRSAPQSASSVDVARCIDWAIRTTHQEFRDRAKLTAKLAVVPRVIADETKLGQVFVNLLVNAAHAITPGNYEGNEVRVTSQLDSGGRVVVEVRDTGSGISKADLERVFTPFFTTKPTGLGTGLGLSICQGIVASFGGQIQVESELGRGTLVRVFLPVAVEDPIASSVPVKGPVESRRGRILVVDDEEMVRRVMARILRDHELCCVGSAREALDLIHQGRSFDLILSDVMMPSMTGVEFFECLLNSNPELARRVVFLSGGAVTSRTEDFLRSIPNPRLDKPFKVRALQDAVQQLLSQQSG